MPTGDSPTWDHAHVGMVMEPRPDRMVFNLVAPLYKSSAPPINNVFLCNQYLISKLTKISILGRVERLDSFSQDTLSRESM